MSVIIDISNAHEVVKSYINEHLEVVINLSDDATTRQAAAADDTQEMSEDWKPMLMSSFLGYHLAKMGPESFSKLISNDELTEIISDYLVEYIEQIAESK